VLEELAIDKDEDNAKTRVVVFVKMPWTDAEPFTANDAVGLGAITLVEAVDVSETCTDEACVELEAESSVVDEVEDAGFKTRPVAAWEEETCGIVEEFEDDDPSRFADVEENEDDGGRRVEDRLSDNEIDESIFEDVDEEI
jgi:hypothetical protein